MKRTGRDREIRFGTHRFAGSMTPGAVLEELGHALGPLAVRVVPPRSGGVLLIGDSAGFYDPFTGEGVFAGLAELVTPAVDPSSNETS